MSSALVAPYERLASSYELELELVVEGRLDEVLQANADREALMASLPATPPAAARPALERAELMRKRAMIELARTRDAIIAELQQVAQGQRTASGYAPPRARRPHIDASA
jgi:hypothetical protein